MTRPSFTEALACLACWLIRRYRSIRRGDHPAIGFDDPRIRAEVRRYNAERGVERQGTDTGRGHVRPRWRR